VNNFPQSLYRQWEQPTAAGKKPDQIPQPTFDLIPGKPYESYTRAGDKARAWPGMIVGAGVIGISKDKDGQIKRDIPLMYEVPVNLEVVRLDEDRQSLASAQATPRNYWIVDDSRTQIWQLDAKSVYVPFDILQKDLGMEKRVLEDGSVEEAKATDIQIKAKPGVDLYKLKPKVIDIVNDYYDIKGDFSPPIAVETWEEVNKTWLGAVEKEKGLVTFLFGIISIVAIFLIFCIFYMIVVEKTKDIGIVKSVGATSAGIAEIFLGYGLTIGILGSLFGLAAGWVVVHYINDLHTWLGRITGLVIWNPEVYAFDVIPNTMNPVEVVVILAIAVIASVLGALVPAVLAAQMQPVEALRWE
jgi:lipoprotein-releasing system permease protein